MPGMKSRTEQRQLKALRDYAAGLLGTRRAMQQAGVEDYAELVIALARHDLDLPKPADTPERRANLERASAILQPLLRNAR
jgi:hypothetical protein